MKNILAFILLAGIVTLISCGSVTESGLSPDEIISNIAAQYSDTFASGEKIYSEAEDEFDRLDEIVAYRYLGNGSEYIELDKFESYCIISASPAAATEIGIIKVNDKADIDTVKDWVRSHFNYVAGIFSSYDEKETNSAKNGEVRVNGKYIYYAIFEESNNVMNKIEDILNK